MLFVALLKGKTGTSRQAAIAHRMEWQLPEGAVEHVAEYWLQSADPGVIVVFEADHISQMWTAFAGWDEFVDISIYPAITAEEGLEILKQMPPP
jgi:hypothetical protein